LTASVSAVIEVRARIVPTNVDFTPRVAELPTCQKTLQAAWVGLITDTRLSVAVTSVDPAWKMKTALGSFWASSVRVPVMARDDGDVYTPGASVIPPRSVGPGNVVVGAREAASL